MWSIRQLEPTLNPLYKIYIYIFNFNKNHILGFSKGQDTEFVTDFGSDILSPGLQSQCFEKIDMQNSKIKKKGE